MRYPTPAALALRPEPVARTHVVSLLILCRTYSSRLPLMRLRRALACNRHRIVFDRAALSSEVFEGKLAPCTEMVGIFPKL